MFTVFKMVAIVMLIITGIVRLGQGRHYGVSSPRIKKVPFVINNYYIWTKGITIDSCLKLYFFFSSTPKNCQKAMFNRVVESV